MKKNWKKSCQKVNNLITKDSEHFARFNAYKLRENDSVVNNKKSISKMYLSLRRKMLTGNKFFTPFSDVP